jgi:hypothetical protein
MVFIHYKGKNMSNKYKLLTLILNFSFNLFAMDKSPYYVDLSESEKGQQNKRVLREFAQQNLSDFESRVNEQKYAHICQEIRAKTKEKSETSRPSPLLNRSYAWVKDEKADREEKDGGLFFDKELSMDDLEIEAPLIYFGRESSRQLDFNFLDIMCDPKFYEQTGGDPSRNEGSLNMYICALMFILDKERFLTIAAVEQQQQQQPRQQQSWINFLTFGLLS